MFSGHQRNRSERKVRWFSKLPAQFSGAKILDIGCAEGYVGFSFQSIHQCEVELVDVVDMNKTKLPFQLYNGRDLPFGNQEFDFGLLIFVLHHCQDSERVLDEAFRVCRRLVILESTYVTAWDLKQLTFLDKGFNRIRSAGKMTDQEEFLNFRKDKEWQELFREKGMTLEASDKKGRYLHQQSLYLLSKD